MATDTISGGIDRFGGDSVEFRAWIIEYCHAHGFTLASDDADNAAKAYAADYKKGKVQ